MTIEQSLNLASQKISPLEAEILLAHVLKIDRISLYKNSNDRLKNSVYKKFKNKVRRRLSGEPVAYLTNHKEFYGLDFYVDKCVFIPRPETELLVEEVLKIANRQSLIANRFTVADIGTGSGCISITLAKKLKTYHSPTHHPKRKFLNENLKLKIYGIDISKEALEVAKINARKHKVISRIKFLQGNLLEPLPEKVDIIIANLPYVNLTILKRSPKDYWTLEKEPKVAWDGGKDGLDVIKRFLKRAPNYLRGGGKIFIEIDYRQKRVLEKFGAQFKKDLAGLDRVVILAPPKSI